MAQPCPYVPNCGCSFALIGMKKSLPDTPDRPWKELLVVGSLLLLSRRLYLFRSRFDAHGAVGSNLYQQA